MKRLVPFVLTLVICLILFLEVAAQTDAIRTYTAPDDSFSFEYPDVQSILVDGSNPQQILLSGFMEDAGLVFVRVFNPRYVNLSLLAEFDTIPTDAGIIAEYLTEVWGVSCTPIQALLLDHPDVVTMTCNDVNKIYLFPLPNSNWTYVVSGNIASEAHEQMVLEIIQSLQINPEMDLTTDIQIDVSDTPTSTIESLWATGFLDVAGQMIVEAASLTPLPEQISLIDEIMDVSDYVMAVEITQRNNGVCSFYGHAAVNGTQYTNYLAFALLAGPELAYRDTYGGYLATGYWTIGTYSEDDVYHLLVLVRGEHLTIFVDGRLAVMDAFITSNPGGFAIQASDNANCQFRNLWIYSIDEERDS